MAEGIGDILAPISDVWNQASQGGGSFGAGWITIIAFIIGVGVISVLGVFIWFHFSEKRKWHIKIRVHYENPDINGISIGNPILARRMRFKDGRVVYLYKTPVQGYRISPELLTWTRPSEHDIIVTQDKRLFSLVGITSIDIQRKKLRVDVAYPDIEMDRQDLQQFIDQKNIDNPNERLKMILKTATYIFLMAFFIILIVIGGKSYIEGKQIDASRDRMNLETSKYQAQTMEQVNTFIAILKEAMPESFGRLDGKVLINQSQIK